MAGEKMYVIKDTLNREFKIPEKIVARASDELIMEKKKPKKIIRRGNCMLGNNKVLKVDNQVKLYCRQSTNVASQLRVAILKHKWSIAAYYLLFLCEAAHNHITPTILRTCLILLLNHPKSSPLLVEDFLRLCTHYESPKELKKFLKVLFIIKNQSYRSRNPGRYIRSNWAYRVTHNISFLDL